MFEPTAKSAIEYAGSNKLEEWVHEFLCGEGNNKKLSDALKIYKREYVGPKLMDLHLLTRCYGPEPEMECRIPEENQEQTKNFGANIDKIAKRFKTGGWDMPPLLALDCNGKFEIDDGNHRYEALKKLGIKKYWVILSCRV